MEMKLDYLMGSFFVFLYINDLVCVSSTLGIIVFTNNLFFIKTEIIK